MQTRSGVPVMRLIPVLPGLLCLSLVALSASSQPAGDRVPIQTTMWLENSAGEKVQQFKHGESIVLVVEFRCARDRIVIFSNSPSPLVPIGNGLVLTNTSNQKSYEFMETPYWSY